MTIKRENDKETDEILPLEFDSRTAAIKGKINSFEISLKNR